MNTDTRWITNTIKAANDCKTKMPWERGARRTEFVARRNYEEVDRNKVTLAPVPAWLTQAISA